MKQIKINVYTKEDCHLHGLVEIESDDYVLIYAGTRYYHGLQCKHDGDIKEYNNILAKLRKMSDLAMEIEENS